MNSNLKRRERLRTRSSSVARASGEILEFAGSVDASADEGGRGVERGARRLRARARRRGERRGNERAGDEEVNDDVLRQIEAQTLVVRHHVHDVGTGVDLGAPAACETRPLAGNRGHQGVGIDEELRRVANRLFPQFAARVEQGGRDARSEPLEHPGEAIAHRGELAVRDPAVRVVEQRGGDHGAGRDRGGAVDLRHHAVGEPRHERAPLGRMQHGALAFRRRRAARRWRGCRAGRGSRRIGC